jgi:transglutaminase-like putative cysteine protease
VLSPLPIFRITADVDGPLYLKTDVFDHYDGRNWKTTFRTEDTIRDQGSILLRGRPRRRDAAIRVELLIEFYNKLPYTLDTSAFRFGREVPLLETGHFHRGFQLVDPLVAGDVIFVERSAIQPIRLTDEERRRYLQLPRGMSGELNEVAAAFQQPDATPHQRLNAINDYLSDTCTYSLNVDNLRRSESFIDKFLFDERKGYCVHFATAFTALARMNGFPARYNEGFLINFPGTATETEVTGLSAHSWPEVWIDGTGWTRWEATPAVNPSAYANFFDEEELLSMYGFDMEMDSFTLRQVQSILGDRELDITLADGEELEPAAPVWTPLRIAAAAGGLILAVLLAWRLVRRLRAPRVARELRPLMRLSQRYVTLGRTLGVPDPRRTGWVAWRDEYRSRSARRAPAAHRLVERFTTLVARAVYGGESASDRDLRFLRAAYWRLLRYRLFGTRRGQPPGEPAGEHG